MVSVLEECDSETLHSFFGLPPINQENYTYYTERNCSMHTTPRVSWLCLNCATLCTVCSVLSTFFFLSPVHIRNTIDSDNAMIFALLLSVALFFLDYAFHFHPHGILQLVQMNVPGCAPVFTFNTLQLYSISFFFCFFGVLSHSFYFLTLFSFLIHDSQPPLPPLQHSFVCWGTWARPKRH